MENINYSEHARKRCVQRGISQKIIDLVLEYGRSDYDSRGGCRYFLGKLEKQRLQNQFPDLAKKMGRKLDAVVVVASKGDPTIITTFVRNRKH